MIDKKTNQFTKNSKNNQEAEKVVNAIKFNINNIWKTIFKVSKKCKGTIN